MTTMSLIRTVLPYVTVFGLWSSLCAAQDKTLYIGSFYPLTKAFSAWGRGCKPAADLAVRHINNRSDVLDGHRLELIHMDTQGSPGVATRELFTMLQSPPTKIAILGPFPSHIAQAVAQTARWWHLVQVSPAAFTPELSDRSQYPYFFRTRAALTTFNQARIAFIKSLGWSRVAILTWQTNYFILTTDVLFKDLEAANISVVTTEVYQTENLPQEEMQRIKSLNVRIIFVFAYEEKARQVFCQAHKLGMVGHKYVYILHYGNDPYWMTEPTKDGSCTAEEISAAAHGHFVTGDVTLREDGKIPLAGMNTTDFMEQYLEEAESQQIPPSVFYAPLTYDAVWSLALALNGSTTRLPATKKLEEFKYEENDVTEILMEEMEQLQFEGMTGTVTFSETGNVGALQTKIQRYIGERTYSPLAYHDAVTGQLTWIREISWEGNNIPHDDLRILPNHIRISQGLFYTLLAVACAGISTAIWFLGFNIIKRQKKLIRMSSPSLNNLIVSGSILCYTSVVLYGVDSLNLSKGSKLFCCHLRLVVLAAGFSIGFGALFAKTWRVFKIFTNKTAKRLMISDRQLFGMVGGFLFVDALYFTLWFTLDKLDVEARYLPLEDGSEDRDYLLQPIVTECASNQSDIWQLVLYLIKGILLIFGVFLAWQTRKVTIPALNDSKYIGFAVYNITMLCLVGVPASFILDDKQVDVKYAISAGCILICTTMTLCIVFIPKVLNIRNPVVQTANTTTKYNTGSVLSANEQICKICKARLGPHNRDHLSTVSGSL